MKFILFILSLTLLKRIFSLKKLKQDEVIDEKNIEAYVKKLTADNYSLREGIKFLKKEVKEEKKVVIQVTQDKEKLLKDIDNLDQKIEEQIRMLKFEKFLNNQRVIPQLQELRIQLHDFANSNILMEILQFSEGRVDEIKNNAETKIDHVHANENEVRKLEGIVNSQSEFKLKQIMKNVAGMESEIQKLEKQVFELENNVETNKIKNKFFTLGLI